MKKSPLNVFAGGKRTGQLAHSDLEEDTILFTHHDSATPVDAVSLTMPVRVDQYDAMGGLLPIFEMNLPEGALKERLRLQFAKTIPEFDDLDLLAIVGSSQIGRLRYSQTQQLALEVPEQNLDEILTWEGAEDLFAHLLERFASYSGVSGVQPKVLVREQVDAGIGAIEKLTHRGATHIVKSFDGKEYPELAANEWICTQGAQAAGIVTAKVRLSANRQFLIVDRFDLTPAGIYLGLEDFCVLDGRRAHGRYDGSYERITKRIADFVSAKHLAASQEQYALTVAYACAIENGDAHLKNFSVLYDTPEGEVALAPAYDMVSTTPYIARDTLALTLGGSKRFPERKQLISFIRHATGRSDLGAGQLLDQVAAGVSVAIDHAKHYARRYKDAARFSESLIRSMTRGVQRLAGS
ncbi:MAG: type II toxin-antitoxin system HipA family toxin [Steroidobacteraceae bacterium]